MKPVFASIPRRRALLLVFVAIAAGAAGGCVRNVRVPRQLNVGPQLTLAQLVERVNAHSAQREISSPVMLRFRDLRGAAVGRNKEYPAADGRLILSRPERIRLQVKVPVVGTKIADMVSDGEKFRLKLLYPENKRRFITGSNEGQYRRVEADSQAQDPDLQRAGTLANVRPQHLTEAFLVRPVALDGAETIYFLDESRQIERDTAPGARSGAEVERTYYVLTLLERVDGGPEARVVRRIWFDRTKSGTELARQETYERGRLATRITYDEYATVAGGLAWPTRVRIERIVDGYSVEVIFPKSEVEINGDVPETAFVLENAEKLPEVDLDALPAADAAGDAGR